MNNKKPYHDVLALIPRGKKNGVSRNKIAETLRISPRDVSNLVLQARRDHFIIASGSSGYYIPANLAEAYEYYSRLHSMAITILDSLKDCRAELKEAGYFDKAEGGKPE